MLGLHVGTKAKNHKKEDAMARSNFWRALVVRIGIVILLALPWLLASTSSPPEVSPSLRVEISIFEAIVFNLVTFLAMTLSVIKRKFPMKKKEQGG